MALEMLETRKRPAAILASKRLAVGGNGFLLCFTGNIFLFVHRELRRNLESVLNLEERPSGEENLWGVGMRGEARDLLLPANGSRALLRRLQGRYMTLGNIPGRSMLDRCHSGRNKIPFWVYLQDPMSYISGSLYPEPASKMDGMYASICSPTPHWCGDCRSVSMLV